MRIELKNWVCGVLDVCRRSTVRMDIGVKVKIRCVRVVLKVSQPSTAASKR